MSVPDDTDVPLWECVQRLIPRLLIMRILSYLMPCQNLRSLCYAAL